MLSQTTLGIFSQSKTAQLKPKIQIRKANENDIKDIINIVNVTFPATYKDAKTKKPCFSQCDLDRICQDLEKDYRNILFNKLDNHHAIFVACDHEKSVGFAKITKDDKASFLDKLYVLPKFQGHNYGNLLLLACMKKSLFEFDSNQIRLGVWNGNAAGIRYYEKNQFHSTTITHAKITSEGVFKGIEMICEEAPAAYDKLLNYLHFKDSGNVITPVNERKW